MLLDCISQVTETKNKFQGLPLGARAVQIADGSASTYFLTTFGRATRETVCSCEVKMEPTLSQALHLLNGDTVDAEDRQRRPHRQAAGGEEDARRRSSRNCTSAAWPQADAEELQKLLEHRGRRAGQEAGAWKTSSGRC